jgi:hypothetical protein
MKNATGKPLDIFMQSEIIVWIAVALTELCLEWTEEVDDRKRGCLFVTDAAILRQLPLLGIVRSGFILLLFPR